MNKMDALRAMLDGKFVVDPGGLKWRAFEDWFQWFDVEGDGEWTNDFVLVELHDLKSEGWQMFEEQLEDVK